MKGHSMRSHAHSANANDEEKVRSNEETEGREQKP